MALYGARAEYAIHTVLNLHVAATTSAPSARDLAGFQKLPYAFTRQLMSDLHRAGIVEGREGVRGGWRLARPESEITVLDVVEAVQGSESLFECRDVRTRCALWPDGSAPASAREGTCEIHAVMLAAEERMRAELSRHTIADLMDRVDRKSSSGWPARLGDWFERQYAKRGHSAKEKQLGEA